MFHLKKKKKKAKGCLEVILVQTIPSNLASYILKSIKYTFEAINNLFKKISILSKSIIWK